jgi:hypothetical protein
MLAIWKPPYPPSSPEGPPPLLPPSARPARRVPLLAARWTIDVGRLGILAATEKRESVNS